jgi:hypothetical protein
MWRWRIRTRAWWIDLARPSLKTCVCSLRSKKSCGGGKWEERICESRAQCSRVATVRACGPT